VLEPERGHRCPPQIENLARRIVWVLYEKTYCQSLQSLSLIDVSVDPDAATAIQFAVKRGWLLFEDGEYVRLTDKGRKLTSG
jgi:hypothetical protein